MWSDRGRPLGAGALGDWRMSPTGVAAVDLWMMKLVFGPALSGMEVGMRSTRLRNLSWDRKGRDCLARPCISIQLQAFR